MRLVRVAAGVVNQTPFDWDQNLQNILNAIEIAKREQTSILCLPELCISGYGCEDAFHAPSLQETSIQILKETVASTQGIIVSVGLPVYFRGGLFNTACLIANGKILGFVGKQNLAGEGLHYEPRWFKPWPRGVRSEIRIGVEDYPIGDLMFETNEVRIGFEICEDAWVANRPGGELAIEGVDILLNPSASHFAFHKQAVRRRFVLDGSRAFSAVYIYANLLGNEAGRAIYDGDAMIASCGSMVATGPRFSFRDVHVVGAQIDLDAVRVGRSRSASYRPEVDDDANCVEFDFDFLLQDKISVSKTSESWEGSSELKEEEFTHAIALGLFDYMRKSRSRGFVVSLSGGADSSAVAILCACMVELALNEIGADGLAKKLAYLSEFDASAESDEIVGQLLTCVYQSTRNSTQTTMNAAKAVAMAIGARFIQLDVDDAVQNYIEMVSQALDRELTWEKDDLALQNIQARARGPSVWLLANLTGSLLLATSNRSEAAVGYATMDGDTCGGLSPIAGIDKAFLRQWLRWMEKTGPKEIGPIAALKLVNVQEPTAELRPQSENQTDESDLMPYDLLDAIERAAIRDKKGPKEIVLILEADFPQHSLDQLGTWIDRFFRLWCRNQWKRERYAPSFHVDDENLDPKTWCRFPILSGGFQRELREMHDFIRDRLAKT